MLAVNCCTTVGLRIITRVCAFQSTPIFSARLRYELQTLPVCQQHGRRQPKTDHFISEMAGFIHELYVHMWAITAFVVYRQMCRKRAVAKRTWIIVCAIFVAGGWTRFMTIDLVDDSSLILFDTCECYKTREPIVCINHVAATAVNVRNCVMARALTHTQTYTHVIRVQLHATMQSSISAIGFPATSA